MVLSNKRLTPDEVSKVWEIALSELNDPDNTDEIESEPRILWQSSGMIHFHFAKTLMFPETEI